MEHLYKSIEIKNYLICFFPLPDLAIELIIKDLKLAIDLNGYTNEMLKIYILNYFSQFHNYILNYYKVNKLNVYLRKKYGKYRSSLGLLKKFHLIHLIQHFNINIPLKPYVIDVIKQFQNNINITSNNNIITIKVDDKVIELKPNMLIELNVMVEDNLYLYYKEIRENKIYNYVLVSKRPYSIKVICNFTSGPNITKIALLCYYTILISNTIYSSLDELYIEMRKILLLLYDRCHTLKSNDINRGITISQNELQNIRSSLLD